MFTNERVFLKQFFSRYHTTGSVLPSSRALARALCRYVGEQVGSAKLAAGGGPRAVDNGRRILEVGPGTGAVTACLVKKMRPTDRLTLVELNDDFVRHLRGRFEREPAFAAVAERTEIVHTRLEDLPQERRFDLIISGLPLNNFEVAEVEQILAVFERLVAAGGTLSFFEYIAIRRVKALVSGRSGRERLRGIGAAIGRALDGREIKRDWVWPNVPPAWVHHVRWNDEATTVRRAR
jgi:phospholipid N-methyltransferase